MTYLVDSLVPVKNLTSLLLLLAAMSSCRSLQPLAGPVKPAPIPQKTVFLDNVDLNNRNSGPSARGPVLQDGDIPRTYPTSVNNEIEGSNRLQFKYSILLNEDVENLDDMKLLSAVDDWYGVRYHYGGNSKAGVDCSGFTSNIYRSVYGITLSRIARDQYRDAHHVSRDQLEEGDLVFFDIRGNGVSHVGIYLRNGRFIHASLREGVRVDDLANGYYKDHFVGGGRMEAGNGDQMTAVSER